MKQIAIDICVYCCGKADYSRVIEINSGGEEIEIGLCETHKYISQEEIKDIIGDVKLKENCFNNKS